MCSRIIVAITILAVLNGCTGQKSEKPPPDPRPERIPQATLDCIYIKAINDWKVVDDFHVIIYAPTRSSAYLVDLISNCHALQYENHVRFKGGGDGRLCAFRSDAILVKGQRCTIGAIRPYKEEPTPPAAPATP